MSKSAAIGNRFVKAAIFTAYDPNPVWRELYRITDRAMKGEYCGRDSLQYFQVSVEAESGAYRLAATDMHCLFVAERMDLTPKTYPLPVGYYIVAKKPGGEIPGSVRLIPLMDGLTTPEYRKKIEDDFPKWQEKTPWILEDPETLSSGWEHIGTFDPLFRSLMLSGEIKLGLDLLPYRGFAKTMQVYQRTISNWKNSDQPGTAYLFDSGDSPCSASIAWRVRYLIAGRGRALMSIETGGKSA